MAKKRYRLRKTAIIETVIITLLLAGIVAVVLWLYYNGKSESLPVIGSITADIHDSTQVPERNEPVTIAADEEKVYSDFHIDGLPENDFKSENFVTRNGYSFYTENGQVTSLAGIDISEFQGDIDWEMVKAAGIDFAMIRVGCRTYGTGEIVMDTWSTSPERLLMPQVLKRACISSRRLPRRRRLLRRQM